MVDESDNPIGKSTKEETHLNDNIIHNNLLHRAFSVFLFDSMNRLLLQQRSAEKITFPLHWTNSCCSHPLWNDYEMVQEDAVGCKRAAIRKLNHELGIPLDQFCVQDFKYIGRIHYMASYDEKWGEHEIDYVLFVKCKDFTMNLNKNEVMDTEFVSETELKCKLLDPGLVWSPWFRKIVESSLLSKWWNQVIIQDNYDGPLKEIIRFQ